MAGSTPAAGEYRGKPVFFEMIEGGLYVQKQVDEAARS